MDKPGLRDALPQPKLSDTRTDPFWSNLDSSLSAAAAPSAAKTPQRDLDVGLGDVARGVGAGALDLVGGIGELARQASQFGKENAGKQGGDYLEQARANMASKLSPVLDVVAGAGDLAKSGAESLTEGMSDDAKEAIGRSLIDETPEGRLTMGDGAGDLDVWAMKMAQGVGSMVPTLLAGGVTGAAAKASIGRAVTTSMIKRGATQEVAEAVAAKTVAKLATGAAVTTGATGSVGSAGVNTRESVLGMSFDELSRSDTFRQAFTRIDQDQQTQHLSDEEKLSLAREETANVASRATMSDAKVWGAAAMGSVMGDAMLFKMLAGKAATGGVLKGAAKGAVGEGIGETLEEGVQQYTINESLNEVAVADIDPMKGVVSSALEGGLIGVGTGGALGGAGGLRGSKSQPESEGGAQVDPATAEDVAPVEPGDPMQENPAAAPADPDLAPAADAMADPVVAPSGEQSPLGPSASQFDELRDVPAYLRRDDTAERFKGMAESSPVQEALSGTSAPTVDDLLSQAASQQVDTIEDPAISSRQQAVEENAAEQLTATTDTAEGTVADNTAQAQPLEQNPAPSALDAVVGSLQTLRITRKGKPFATEKEAAMASSKGKEMPVPLNGGGFGVAEIAEVEQVKAAATTQPSAPQLDDISVTDQNQPSDQPAASVSAETVPAPSATSGDASQLAPAIDTGYREVIPVNQPQTEVSNEPVTPVPAISSEGQGDQPGAGEPAAAGAGPAIAGLADRAGSGNPADNTTAPPVPDGQQQDDPTLTAPAPDAGAAVSEVAQPDPVVPAPVAAPTPWAEAIDNPDGTITLKGDVPLIKQWAKESGVKAMPGKGGLLVAKSSAAKVREFAAPAANEPVQQIEAARAEVAPEPTDAQKEAGNYKKGHLKLQGLDIALENPKGSTRSGTDQDGRAWQSTMAHDYGYIKRTLGADGDHVDVFIGEQPDSETVYVVDQVDPKTGKFDEHKVMMGFTDEQAAQAGYLANYEKGWKGLGSIKAMPVEEFNRWVKEGDTTKPVGEQPAAGVDIGTLTDDEVLAVADELGISHDDNPDDARWGLEGAKKDVLSTAIARVRNPSSTTPIKPAASNSNSNIVSAPPLQDEGGGAKRAVSFSKQAMAQGEKPAKHLTRKEAELVTKEWFKQYRGASGINVQIHATQAELEKALGLAAKDGLIRRAAFDDDNGTLHVAADTIANPKRMREILRHEVLAHYGLANVLGDGEYTKLISRIIKSKSAPSMKAVWDWVDTHYAGEDVGVQAEEVIAHLAELEQSAWRRGWDQVVAWVTKALRTVGFVPGGITAAETRVLIEGLGKKMKRGGPDNGGPDGGQKFSQEADKQSDPFTPNMGEADAYRQQLKNAMSSLKSGEIVIEIGHTPAVLRRVGAPDLPLRITRDIVRKATNGVKHDVPMHVIEKMPELLHDPVAVFDSRTESDAKTILVDAVDTSGRPVITAIHLNAKAGRVEINRIASVYGKDNGIGAMERWIDEGLLRYARKKQNPLGTTQGLQLPKRGSPERVYDSNILTKDDIRKGGLKMSQANTAADKAMEKLNLGPKPDIIDNTKANLAKLRKVDRGVVESWVDRFIKKANTEVLDALAPIKYAEDAAGITDAADSGYVAARMATGAASTMQATMLYGLPEWKDGVIQRKAGTGEKDALLGIFSDLGADLHNWLGWMAGHRAELLMAQGRENLLDANDIAALKGQGKGKEAKFLDAKARWNRLNAATLDLAQEAGLFTKEARAEFESEWYIPFFRETEDGDVIAHFKPKGIANQNAGIKKLKGGEANTNDLLENIFTSTSKLIDASMKNMAAQKTVWNLADTGLIEVVAKPNMMDWRALKNGKDLITVKLEGEDYMIRVEDPDLYRAMTFFDRQPFGTMINLASKAKRLLTAGVTASPEFMLRNFLRDSLSSWAITKDGFKPVIDSIKGVKKTLAMDGSTIDVMFSGASFLGGYVNGNDPTAMADTVRKSLRRKGMTPEQIARYEKSIIRNAAQAKGVVANVWEKYNRYGEAFENANREAVYAAAIKAGKSHAQAAFESKDLMDFSMMGAARFIQGASLVLPFFNARLQGLGKLSRELRDNPREIAKRAGMITAMSLGLLAANWDDERYEELPDWDKDANWHFFVGDQHFRIPKPFEIGVMFGTIPERMVRAMGDKDTGAQFGKAVARAIGDTFALNPTPQIVKPLVEAAFNYDTFRGAPIDSPQDLAVKAEARYNEQTSLLMRELGEMSGLSPKQLEHLVIGYTGTMGSYVMATADGLIRAYRPGESASWRADEIPLVKAVYRGTGPAKTTQHMEQFYQMLNEVNQLKRTVDQYRSEGLDDKANELLEEQGGILKSRLSLSRTQQQVRVVRNKIELIQRDRTMNAEEKRKRIDELLARRNDLVYRAVNNNRLFWEE
ncbi:LPD38 domain-containing protein [Aeromonas sp. 600886]|uniref:LPD38 domain-containing protein n=1 Tax=Aeromonas sp. 600886 TaxID=2712033 RepID=UPI003BA34DF2